VNCCSFELAVVELFNSGTEISHGLVLDESGLKSVVRNEHWCIDSPSAIAFTANFGVDNV
jgi:hypothetical protein